MKQVTLRFEDEVYERIRSLAKRDTRSTNSQIRFLIYSALAEDARQTKTATPDAPGNGG